MHKPKLSIIVIFYNMRREAERTLYSLSSHYQAGVAEDDYEVIVLDNGSTLPLDENLVTAFGSNFRYYFYSTRSVSPAGAVNHGVKIARADHISVIVDGARMLTPGLLSTALGALNITANPFLCALGWHLGPDVQHTAMLNGYDKVEEDRLLDSINWPDNGYKLFEISTLAPSSGVGFLRGMPSESSWFAMSKSTFKDMGGFDERFQQPGGGMVNHDFLNRGLLEPSIYPILVLGEGTFHQVHGGVATNCKPSEHPGPSFRKDYAKIHGREYEQVFFPNPCYVGKMGRAAKKFVRLDKGWNS